MMQHTYEMTPLRMRVDTRGSYGPVSLVFQDQDGDAVIVQLTMNTREYAAEIGPNYISARNVIEVLTKEYTKALDDESDTELFLSGLPPITRAELTAERDKYKNKANELNATCDTLTTVIAALEKLVIAEAPGDSDGGIQAVAKRYVNVLDQDECSAIGKYYGDKEKAEKADDGWTL